MAKLTQIFLYKNRIFMIDDAVQAPDAYSVFLEENLALLNGETALDVGVGSGFLSIMMAERAKKVTGIDINPHAVNCAKKNVLINDVIDTVEIRMGSLPDAITTKERFDLIVAWPPVLPTPPGRERHDWVGINNEGGWDGRTVIDRIIKHAASFLNPNGRLQILHAWYNNVPKSLEILGSLGFKAEVTAEKYFPVGRLSFERASYLCQIGFPLIERDGRLMQIHSVVTASLP